MASREDEILAGLRAKQGAQPNLAEQIAARQDAAERATKRHVLSQIRAARESGARVERARRGVSTDALGEYETHRRRAREDALAENARRALPAAEVAAQREREASDAERNRAGFVSENERTGRDERGFYPRPEPLNTQLPVSPPQRSVPKPAATPGRAPFIPNQRTSTPGAGPSWVPEPNTVLVLGFGLVLLTLLSKQGGVTSFINLFWNQSEGTTGLAPLAKTLVVESGFILVLYILSNLSDTLARAAVLFELGLYLMWLIANPGSVAGLASTVKNLTSSGSN